MGIKIRNDGIGMGRQEQELFRTLRTNIELSGDENRVIMISSCMPDDGKTTVAYYLACTFAEAEKSVLLVDADMRKSVLMKRLGMSGRERGLSEVLRGKAEPSDIICEMTKRGVYVLPPGKNCSNATELLGSEKFRHLIEESRANYDYVIVDTPPLGSVIDAAVAARCCDGSVMVVRYDYTSRADAQAIIEQLRAANENILGVVLNQVNMKERRSYTRRYGYGYRKYGYGYGYGAGEEKDLEQVEHHE